MMQSSFLLLLLIGLFSTTLYCPVHAQDGSHGTSRRLLQDPSPDQAAADTAALKQSLDQLSAAVKAFGELADQLTGALASPSPAAPNAAAAAPPPSDTSSSNTAPAQESTVPSPNPSTPVDPSEYAWVTPTTLPYKRKGCNDSCADLGAGWRSINGGSSSMVLCAGLIDMPGLGQQWLAGWTPHFQAMCHILCATQPCWNLPAGARRDFDFVQAGGGNSYTAADGSAQAADPFPVKCACTRCAGAECDKRYWAPANSSAGCQLPTIPPQAGESFPSTMHAAVCRSTVQDGSYGYTGWLGEDQKCKIWAGSGQEYSVWCQGGHV